MTTRKNAAMAALGVACEDKLERLWYDAITTWARSQRSMRIAMRCRDHEHTAIGILCDSATMEVTHGKD